MLTRLLSLAQPTAHPTAHPAACLQLMQELNLHPMLLTILQLE